MKTSSGKTKHARPASRVIQIYRVEDTHLLAVKKAASLKQALLEYYKETLAKQGCKGPKVIGNVLSVTVQGGESRMYRALEVYQQA